ncbi:unnamed protein product [Rhodiola kirilowii]
MTSTYGEGGAGGKLRRNPPRRQQSTPYARPLIQSSRSPLNRTEDSGDGRAGGWLSKIVDPAYRLISGSATRILPSFFSKSSSAAALPSSDQDDDSNGDAHCDDQDHETDLGSSRLLEEAGQSRLNDLSKADMRQENGDSAVNGSGLSEIEQLMRGKLFSRDEANRLTEILRLKADGNSDDQGGMRNPCNTRQSDPSIDLSANELPRLLTEQKREILNIDTWELAASTPLRRPTLPEVGASPIDIARAYMGSISTGIGTPGRSAIQDDNQHTDQKDGFRSVSKVPPSSSKPSICWPGALVQEHQGFLTPQNSRSKFGLYSSQRSPYSRTIDSKSKLKHQLTPSVDRHMSLHVSESPFRRIATPGPRQGIDMGDASVDGYRSLGPIRSKRHNKVTHSPFRGSAVQKPVTDQGTLRVFQSEDPGSARNISQFQHTKNKPYNRANGIQFAHPHSSQMAKRILDHIDRKVPTLREKSEEIRIASVGQKTSPSKLTTPLLQKDKSVLSNGFPSQSSDVDGHKLLAPNLFGIASNSTQAQGGDAGASDSKKHNATQFISSTAHEETKVGKGYTSNVSNQANEQFSSKISFGAVTSESPAVPKAQHSDSFGKKPALASISIDRHNPRSGKLFGNSSGFTFPVPVSSGLLSEPPTPSITPAKVPHQQMEGLSTPLYTFGSKKSSSKLVFSFPSACSFSDQADDLDVKFNFGSDTTNRISFSGFVEHTTVCAVPDSKIDFPSFDFLQLGYLEIGMLASNKVQIWILTVDKEVHMSSECYVSFRLYHVYFLTERSNNKLRPDVMNFNFQHCFRFPGLPPELYGAGFPEEKKENSQNQH